MKWMSTCAYYDPEYDFRCVYSSKHPGTVSTKTCLTRVTMANIHSLFCHDGINDVVVYGMHTIFTVGIKFIVNCCVTLLKLVGFIYHCLNGQISWPDYSYI